MRSQLVFRASIFILCRRRLFRDWGMEANFVSDDLQAKPCGVCYFEFDQLSACAQLTYHQ